MWGLAAETRRCQPAGHDPRVTKGDRDTEAPPVLTGAQWWLPLPVRREVCIAPRLVGEPQTYDSRAAMIK